MYRYEVQVNNQQDLEYVKRAVAMIGELKVDAGQVGTTNFVAHVRFTSDTFYTLDSIKSHCVGYWIWRVDRQLIDENVLVQHWRSEELVLEGL